MQVGTFTSIQFQYMNTVSSKDIFAVLGTAPITPESLLRVPALVSHIEASASKSVRFGWIHSYSGDATFEVESLGQVRVYGTRPKGNAGNLDDQGRVHIETSLGKFSTYGGKFPRTA